MNLPNINFRDIIGKLSVFKNNTALLVPVIIVFVAAILIIPTVLVGGRVRKNVKAESITKGASVITRLKQNPVSGEQYQIELARQTARANDANEIARLALQTTQREILSYDIFPEPDPNADFSAVIFQVFGDRFRAGVDTLVRDIQARDCPTNEEIQRAIEKSSVTRSRLGRNPMMDTLGTPSSRPGMPSGGLYPGGGGAYGMMGGRVNQLIIDEICEARAKEVLVYIDPMTIAGYEFWENYTYEGKDEAINDTWYHQLAYWVIEDMFDTIQAMNASHENVLTAPVKRLMSLSFTMGLKRPRSGGGGGVFRGARGRRSSMGGGQSDRENADKPIYVLSASEGLSESCTGRICVIDDLHVIHFNVAFVVNVTDVLPLMDALCSVKEHQFKGYDGTGPAQTFKHNQITVLECKTGFLNAQDMAHRNYRYGQGNPVELDLICEYIFKSDGYKDILPEPVSKTIAGEDEETK